MKNMHGPEVLWNGLFFFVAGLLIVPFFRSVLSHAYQEATRSRLAVTYLFGFWGIDLGIWM